MRVNLTAGGIKANQINRLFQRFKICPDLRRIVSAIVKIENRNSLGILNVIVAGRHVMGRKRRDAIRTSLHRFKRRQDMPVHSLITCLIESPAAAAVKEILCFLRAVNMNIRACHVVAVARAAYA